MKLEVIIIFGLLATASYAITYPQDYIIVDNFNLYFGDQLTESCTSEQEFISKAIPWIGQNPLLGVTWEENKKTCFFKILTQTNGQAAFDGSNHNKVRFLFYAEIFQENYGLLRGIDFTAADIRDENSNTIDSSLQKAVAFINKDPKKTVTFTRDHIWYKNIEKVNPGISGNHEICQSVIYGRQLKYNTRKFQHDYFMFENMDFTGGDISSERCDSLENAIKRVPQLIQENPNYAATYVDDQKTLYFKILQRTNPSAVDQNTHNRCKSFIYAEVLKSNAALIRGLNFPGGNIKDEQVKNDDEAIQKALGFVNVDNFVCWQKRENRFSHTFYYQTLRKSNPSSAGVWKTSTTCVFQAKDLNIVPEVKLQYTLDCGVLYDECGFKGNSYDLCDDAPVLPDKFTVKSVRVPKGFTVEVYADPQYKGGKIILDKDAECLQLSDFQ